MSTLWKLHVICSTGVNSQVSGPKSISAIRTKNVAGHPNRCTVPESVTNGTRFRIRAFTKKCMNKARYTDIRIALPILMRPTYALSVTSRSAPVRLESLTYVSFARHKSMMLHSPLRISKKHDR